MTIVSSDSRERDKITELARRYSAKGYNVFAEVGEFPAPEPIDWVTPDLVAKKTDEVIIVEVMTRESMKRSKDTIAYLAAYARETPGTRFDLVVTNPKPQASVEIRMRVLQEELETLREGMLADIDHAIGGKRTGLALVLAARLLEGALVRAAAKKGMELSTAERSLTTLAGRLRGENIVSESVVEFAHELQRERDAYAHRGTLPSTEEALDTYRKLTKLLRHW